MAEKIPKIAYLQYGGKTTIAKWIVSHFPPHHVYCEPFCGSCSVLFAKPKSPIEIVNDLDGRIINAFKVMRERPKELAAVLWATPYANDNLREIVDHQDDLEEARRFIARSKTGYCGSFRFAVNQTSDIAGIFSRWFLRIAPAANRLKACQILNEDAIKTIKRVYKNTDALIYVDPPYIGHEKEYRFGVNNQEMVDVLKEAKAKVIVSEYPEAAKYFVGWKAIEKDCPITAHTGTSKKRGSRKREVLYFNFDPVENTCS